MSGIALGALVQGIEMTGRAYSGGWWDWLTPFSLLCGIAVTVGYGLLGSTWLVMKTQGYLSERMREMSFRLAGVTLFFMGLVSIMTPFQDQEYFRRWFDGPTAIWSFVVPFLVLIAAIVLFTGLKKDHERTPFFAALSFFVLGFIGIGISFYPMIVPPALTIDDAAAPDSSLFFALVGASILIPLILAYTAYAYWVFRGKIEPESGYH